MLRFSIPTHTGYNRKSSLTCCTVGVASPISSNMFLNMVLSCLQAARLRSTPVRTPPFSTTAAVFSSGGWPCVPVDYEPARVSRCRHTSAGEAAPCGRADEIKHTTRSQSTLDHCTVLLLVAANGRLRNVDRAPPQLHQQSCPRGVENRLWIFSIFHRVHRSGSTVAHDIPHPPQNYGEAHPPKQPSTARRKAAVNFNFNFPKVRGRRRLIFSVGLI